MSARHLVIGGATVVALVVLVVTLMWPAGDAPRRAPNSGGPDGTSATWTTEEGARDFLFTSPRDNGQLIEVFGQQLNPKPMGVMEVQWPGARIHLSPNKTVIEIRGRHGTFVAPDNQPKSGRFEGLTVLTLFENPCKGPLDLRDDSPHVAMRVFLQDATFDLDLRTIESDDLVHLTSPQLDFRGKGLRLTYNELRRRLERLVIFEGDHVRIRRTSDLKDLVGDDSENADEAYNDGEGDHATPPPVEMATDPAHYYRAHFERSISISSTEVTAVGSSMQLTFAMAPDAVKDAVDDAEDADGNALRARTTNTPAPLGGRPQADRPLPAVASMVEPREDDIVIEWAGRLLVEPLDEAPSELASPKDVLFAMFGAPLRIDTAKEEHVTASALYYQLATGRVKLEGGDDRMVGISTPKLGQLDVANFTIDQTAAMGWVEGPGSLRAAGELPEVAVDDDTSTDLTGLPAGTTISWRDRVEIAFNRRADADVDSASGTKLNQLASVKSITLRGGVDVQHPQIAVQADEATVALSPPIEGKSSIDGLQATGNVRVRGREAKDEAEFDVQSQHLTVALKRDADGRTYPSQLVASGGVIVTREGGTPRELRTGDAVIDLATAPDERAAATAEQNPAMDFVAAGLDAMDTQAAPVEPGNVSHGVMPALNAEDVFSLVPIELPLLVDRASFDVADAPADPPPAPAPEVAMTPKPKHPKLVVLRVQMNDEVLVDWADPQVLIKAARVDADLPSDQYELFGKEGADASLNRDGATLAAQHIVMSELNQSVYIDTPGTLTFSSRAPQRDGDEEADDRQPVDLTITWTEAMWFDNKNGMALFTGDVVCDAKTDRETTRLTGETLRVRFVAIDSDVLVGDDDEVDDAVKVQRALLDVQALGNARFSAASFRDRPDGVLDTRLTLEGPSIVFDNLQQQVQVDSAGQMLFEDYRPVEEGDDNAAAMDAASPISQISGRGATLFTWTGYLRIDVLRNELLIDRNVRMVHRPMGDTRVATLDCRQLVARLQGEGGLGVWLSDDAPQPELAEVLAIGDVRMRAQERNVSTDLLSYDAGKQLVVLSANEGRRTMVYEANSTQPLQARHFEWDIARDRVRATEVGVIRVQLPE